ncbi:hypothetical protein Q361_11734 [Flavobacterium croceum DSM 17960]|uniref:Uncharacterized protein n=1 Tax=Flavobacterium croceum DSM 17960 TaxID=1121886 RepID=A0A2S4N5I3_9FLAO|nr:hypothetical protein [Flavobacterium croceum]POS00930.1 hypothetical protein Q361_11734 [Flavobacterium croceum DSM 17960]
MENNLNKNTFWIKSKCTWSICGENDNFFRAIEIAINLAEPNSEMNFNTEGNVFYCRGENFCIRVASNENWGVLKNCVWHLNRDASQKFVVAKAFYFEFQEI